MLRTKDGPVWATSRAPLRGISCEGALNSFWKEENSSNCFQAVPNGTGYLDPPEEPTWSKNLDSAASMFPPSTLTPALDVELWRENFQDLSIWCHKPLQDMCSTMVGDTKGSSCIVQDDELNTPEIGVQREFNFTSTPNVLKEVTSPYLSDGEGWEIPAPLNLPQILSVEEDKSYETAKKADYDNAQPKPANEFFVDDTWGLSVSHEEEIVSSHNQGGLNPEVFVVDEELGDEHKVKCMDFGSCESASKASIRTFKTDTVENANVYMGSLESLLGPSFGVRAADSGIFSVLTNQRQAESNLTLKNLLSVSTYLSNTNDDGEITSADDTRIFDRVTDDIRNTLILAKSPGVSPTKANAHLVSRAMESDNTLLENVTTADMLRTDIPVKLREQRTLGNCEQSAEDTALPVDSLANSLPGASSVPRMRTDVNDEMTIGDVSVLKREETVMEENVAKRNLKLNLSTLLGTDDVISTPVVLESLFKQDEPFDLLSYVFDEMECDTMLPASVDLDDRISTPCTTEVTASTKADTAKAQVEPFTDVEVQASHKDDVTVNVMVVKPFVVEASPDRHCSDANTEHVKVKEECNQLSSNVELLRKPNQQFEGGTGSNLRKDLGGNEDEHFPRARRQSRKDLQARTSFESRVSQDGPVLKLKISKIKSDSNTKVLSSQKQSPKKNVSGLGEILLPKQTGGRPVKRAFPSTSKARGSSGSRTRQGKLSSSETDESWTPSKKARTVSVDSDCDRYRELRDRNNEASRKSRQSRKARESDMKQTAVKLERENQSLKIKADEMERLVKKLRQALLEAVVKIKKE